MSDLLKEYIESIEFEEINFDELTEDKINSLENKMGFVIDTDITSLWIRRELSIYNMIGIDTVMESTINFSIMDNFGMIIWSGDAESVIDFADGFVNEDFE